MKSIRTLILAMLLIPVWKSGGLLAQNYPIQSTLTISPPYTNLFSEYLSNQKIHLMLMPTGQGPQNVRITGSLKSTAGVSLMLPDQYSYYASSADRAVYPITVGTSGKLLTTADLTDAFASTKVIDNSSQKLNLDAIGSYILPEGDYELCVKVFGTCQNPAPNGQCDPTDPYGRSYGFTQLADQVCFQFTIASNEAPFLTSPFDGAVITEAMPTYQTMLFNWTWSPNQANVSFINYVLQIAELQDGQSPYNVFESGPLFAEFAIPNASPVYVVKPSDPKFEVGKRYAWRVQVKEKEPQQKYYTFQNKGLSQVHTFQYGGETTATDGAFSVACTYPTNGVSIPFRGIPLIVQYTPYTTKYKAFHSDLTVTDKQGALVLTHASDDDWSRFDSPKAAQQFVIGQAKIVRSLSDLDAQFLPVNPGNSIKPSPLDQYEDHRQMNWSVAVTMTEGQKTHKGNAMTNFTAGMGKPVLKSPAADAKLSAGNTVFQFETSQRPDDKELFPREIVQAKPNQLVTVYALSVRERCVLEVAKANTFNASDIISRQSFPLTYGSKSIPDAYQLADSTYKTISTTLNLPDGRYYWRVRWLTRPDGIESGESYADSEVRSVCVGKCSNDKKDTCTTCPPPTPVLGACNCKFQSVDDVAAKTADLKAGNAIYIGGADGTGYQLTVADITSKKANGKFSGTGTVALGIDLKPVNRSSGFFFPLQVTFTDLQYNAANRLIGGTVSSTPSSNGISLIPSLNKSAPSPAMPGLKDLLKVAEKWDDITGSLSMIEEKATSTVAAQVFGAGLTTPLGIKNAGGLVTIALDNFVFTATSAQFDALAVLEEKNVFGDKPLRIPLGVKGACMPLLSGCPFNTLYLVEDMPLANTGLTLKGGGDVTKATHLLFSTSDKDAGVKALNIVAEYTFPDAIKNAADNGKVVATLVASSTMGFSNWRAGVNLNAPFKIDGLDDFTFALTENAVYDHDAGWNPDGLKTMLDGLDKDIDAGDKADADRLRQTDWNGFFMPKLTLTLPGVFRKASSTGPTATSVTITNVVIDGHTGLTGSLNVDKVFDIGAGSLDGWYFSLDNINLTFFNNSLKRGGATGKIVLPISGEDTSTPLSYSSTLSRDATAGTLKYQFLVKPDKDVNVPIWWAKMSLKETSNITITVGDKTTANPTGSLLAKATLNGDLSISSPDKIAGIIPKLSFNALHFENFVVQSQKPYIQVDNAKTNTFTNFSFASPPKLLGTNAYGLDEVKLVDQDGKPGIYLHGSIDLSADLALKPKAGLGLTILANASLDGLRPKLSYDGVNLEDVAIAGQLGPVSVDGKLKFLRGDATFGDGFQGALAATFPMNIAIKADARFGSVNNSSYWYVYASASGFPPIPIGGPFNITGFGGGAYHNMVSARTPNPTVLPDSTAQPDYKPGKSSGCLATVFLAAGTENLLKGQTTLTVEWDNSGVNKVGLSGTADLFSADANPTTKGIAHGDIDIVYDIKQSIFDLNGGVTVDQSPFIKVDASKALRVYVDANTQFIQIGDPSNNDRRVKLTVLDFISGKTYFWAGNGAMPDIPLPFGIDPGTLQAMGYQSFKDLGLSQAKGGMMFGAAVGFPENGLAKELKFLIFYIRLKASMGFDVSLAKYNLPCGKSTDPPGMNGWYANGQIYASAGFAFGVKVDVWFYEGDVDVASVDATAIFQGGLPNPFWFKGMLYGRYDILGGQVSGDMKFKVSVGDVCVPDSGPIDPFAEPLISEIYPKNGSIDILDNPAASFNYPIGREIVVTVSKPNADGEGTHLETQTFRIDAKVEMIKTGGASNPDCDADLDNSGELRVADDGMSATFYRNAAFAPDAKYDINVTGTAKRLVGATWETMKDKKGAEKTETKTASIATEGCPARLDRNIVALTYPYENQRYVLPGEFGREGFVALNKKLCCFMQDIGPDRPYLLVMKFATELEPDTEQEQTVQNHNPTGELGDIAQTLTFRLPDLPTGKVVRMRLVKKPNPRYFDRYASPKFTASGKATIGDRYNQYVETKGAQAYADADLAKLGKGSVNNSDQKAVSATFSMAIQRGSTGQLRPVPMEVEVLAPVYFRTSRYQTMAEKVKAMDEQADGITYKADVLNAKNVKASFGTGEGFDEYEVGGLSKIIRGQQRYLPPLLGVEFATQRSNWYNQNLKRYYEANARIQTWGGIHFQFTDANNSPVDGLLPGIGIMNRELPLQPNEIPQTLKRSNLTTIKYLPK